MLSHWCFPFQSFKLITFVTNLSFTVDRCPQNVILLHNKFEKKKVVQNKTINSLAFYFHGFGYTRWIVKKLNRTIFFSIILQDKIWPGCQGNNCPRKSPFLSFKLKNKIVLRDCNFISFLFVDINVTQCWKNSC